MSILTKIMDMLGITGKAETSYYNDDVSELVDCPAEHDFMNDDGVFYAESYGDWARKGQVCDYCKGTGKVKA